MDQVKIKPINSRFFLNCTVHLRPVLQGRSPLQQLASTVQAYLNKNESVWMSKGIWAQLFKMTNVTGGRSYQLELINANSKSNLEAGQN